MDRVTLVLATISAILIGLGLAFTGVFFSQDTGAQPRQEAGVVKADVASQPAVAPEETTAVSADSDIAAVVRQLVSDRNQALIAGDWAALAELSVPESPARQADDELRSWLHKNQITVRNIETEILEVTELPRDNAGKVSTDQVAVLVRSKQKTANIVGPADIKAAENSLQCTVWILEGDKISRFEPCE